MYHAIVEPVLGAAVFVWRSVRAQPWAEVYHRTVEPAMGAVVLAWRTASTALAGLHWKGLHWKGTRVSTNATAAIPAGGGVAQ